MKVGKVRRAKIRSYPMNYLSLPLTSRMSAFPNDFHHLSKRTPMMVILFSLLQLFHRRLSRLGLRKNTHMKKRKMVSARSYNNPHLKKFRVVEMHLYSNHHLQ